jgi:hypothetical protein
MNIDQLIMDYPFFFSQQKTEFRVNGYSDKVFASLVFTDKWVFSFSIEIKEHFCLNLREKCIALVVCQKFCKIEDSVAKMIFPQFDTIILTFVYHFPGYEND